MHYFDKNMLRKFFLKDFRTYYNTQNFFVVYDMNYYVVAFFNKGYNDINDYFKAKLSNKGLFYVGTNIDEILNSNLKINAIIMNKIYEVLKNAS